jgi:hypothetical protein
MAFDLEGVAAQHGGYRAGLVLMGNQVMTTLPALLQIAHEANAKVLVNDPGKLPLGGGAFRSAVHGLTIAGLIR